MGIQRGPKIVTSGLVLALDAANLNSYVSGSKNVFDLAGTSVTGSLKNGVGFSNTNVGNFVFDGTNDYISLSPVNPTVSAFSCETFFQWANIGDNKNSLISLCYEYPNKGYLVRQNNATAINGKVIVYTDNGAETYITSTQILSINTWYHLVVVQNSGTCLIYINGVLDSSQSLANPVLGTTSNTLIGRRDANGSYLEGKVAISKVYNRALSASEVLQNYNATKARFGL